MHITARMPEGRNVMVINPHNMTDMGMVYALDSELGYVDRFVKNEDTGKVLVDRENARLLTERVYCDYDVVNRNTGLVVAESRGHTPKING